MLVYAHGMYRLDPTQRRELVELAERATPGGWKARHNKVSRGREFRTTALRNPVLATCEHAADAEFIAAANPAVVGGLLRENESLRVALGDIARLSMSPDADASERIRRLAMQALFGRDDLPDDAWI